MDSTDPPLAQRRLLTQEEREKLEDRLWEARDKAFGSLEELEVELRSVGSSAEEMEQQKEKLIACFECAHETEQDKTEERRNWLIFLLERQFKLRQCMYTILSKLGDVKYAVAQEVVANHVQLVESLSDEELKLVQDVSSIMPLCL